MRESTSLNPGKRVHPHQLTRQEVIQLRSTAAVFATAVAAEERPLLRPTAKHRNDRSVALLSIDKSGLAQ
jgi:hypothetical protein